MSKQKESLEQKHQEIVNQIEAMKKEYDMRLIKFEEDNLHFKKV